MAIKKQRRRRSELALPAKVWSLFLGATVGHGYRAGRAVLWLVGLVLAGSIAFHLAHLAHPEDFKPAKPVDPSPQSHAFFYTLDLALPVSKLHQRDAWIAQGPAQWGWLFTVAGWVLATAAIAAVTGLLKKG